MDELERILLNTLAREKLLPDGARVTAAVSGGADSVAMAYLVSAFAPARGWEVDILHVNHRARPGADGDQEFVAKLAAELCLPFRAVALEPGVSAGEREWSAA
ncbi:MAG TPA: ATP-binding protein, partial [Candidatus Sabulitectum sp.]|nr:ATP-binding protein [Candidatus Sabulitectum sp.]